MEDGYPEEYELKKIEEWDYHDFPGLVEYVYDLWTYKHYWTNEGEGKYKISTGGWSGNESIIAALMENRMFWAVCWVSSKRGGHYEFEVKAISKEATNAEE